MPEQREWLRGELERPQEQGVVRRSTGRAPYSSRSFVIPKKGLSKEGKKRWRLICDWKELNAACVPYCYPLSGRLEDHPMELAGSDIFASTDAEGAFYQILMDPESVPMTAICKVFGLWEFLAMGFGLQAAPGHWCKLMDATFQDCPFVRYWMDDIFSVSYTHLTLPTKVTV